MTKPFRPDRLRIEVERSDGQKGLVIFDGKDITIYTAGDNIYATASRQGTLDQAIKYALDDLKLRMPLALMLLSTLPSELDNLGVSADYVETTTITDVPCDHLAARTAGGVDFQVWVAKGGEPCPGGIVITTKDEKCKSVLRVIATQTILVFVLFFVIQSEVIGARGGGGGARGGGGGYSREGRASTGGFSSGKASSQSART